MPFWKLKNLQWGAYLETDVSPGCWNIAPGIDMLSVPPGNAHWIQAWACRGLEREERSVGGRKGKVWDEMKKELLWRAWSTAAMCDCSHVTKWKTANRAAYSWPAQSFWKFERFYTTVEISGFSWEIFSWPSTACVSTWGMQLAVNEEQLPLWKQAGTLQLETVHTPHPHP